MNSPFITGPADAFLSDVLPQMRQQISSMLGAEVEIVLAMRFSTGKTHAGATCSSEMAARICETIAAQYREAANGKAVAPLVLQ